MKPILCLIFSFFISFGALAALPDENADFNEAYKEMDYTFKEPFVRLNPYRRQELAAVIKFPTEKPAALTVTVVGREGAENLITSYPQKTTEHTVFVLGLYPDYQNQVILKAVYDDHSFDETSVLIQTPKIEKRALIVVEKKTTPDERYYFLHDGIVFDENGWIRLSFSNQNEAVYLSHGELIAEDRNLGLTRYSLAGEKRKHYSFPEGFTSFAHGIAQKPNGNFLVIGSFTGEHARFEGQEQLTQRDFVIEIDFTTGKTVNIIDVAERLNPDRSVIVRSAAQSYGMNDWCHMNAVDYDATDNGIVISCRHAGIAKINEKTKELQWVFSQHKDLEKSGRDGTGPSLKDKLLTAVNSDNEPYENDVQLGTKAVAGFKWPAKTHHVSVLKDGLISVFDNSGELYDKTMATTKNSNAAVYKIDSAHKTVSLKWFEALPFAAESASSVFYEPNKNTVTVYLSTVTDKNQTGISFGKLITYDLTTRAVLFEATVYRGGETYFYRAEPFSFPNQQGEK